MRRILKRTPLDQVPDLSDDIHSRLEKIGITTAELLAHGFQEGVSSNIGISTERMLELTRLARQVIGLGDFRTASEMKEKDATLLETGFECVDNALDGGFRAGSIIELQGQQWAGKTLMCSHLAIRAQLIKTDNGSVPKVIWYDSDQSYRKKRIKEIAYRYRIDPKVALRNIILFDIKKKGKMEPDFESMRRTLTQHHVSLVIIDSLRGALKYLETPSTLKNYVAKINQMALTTGTLFVYTNRSQIVFSRSSTPKHKRNGPLSIEVDYGLQFYLNREGERIVITRDFHGGSDMKCELYLGPGGFFEDRASRNLEVQRVQRYLKRN